MVAGRPRERRADHGQHFLSPRSAAELVRQFELTDRDLVVEVGAGSGRLTRELSRTAGLVLAIKADTDLARRLLRSASSWSNVYVREGDALRTSLPSDPFRVVGNIPFGITTPLLRRLVEVPHVRRLDLVTQLEPALKRAAGKGSVLSVVWGTFWRFEVGRRIPARAFHPPPSVDAAWLLGHPRTRPLVPAAQRAGFERFVRRGFTRAASPLPRALGLSRATTRAAGLEPDVRATDLLVDEWAELWRLARQRDR